MFLSRFSLSISSSNPNSPTSRQEAGAC
uniref:Uncharacterized protein n=1 Tax=Arundo donax TaxID=35708 RepID=A0A0A9FZV7_ARUDO